MSGENMKKTQWKDALRNIRKRWVSYLSVIVIALLGTSIFLAIGFGSKAIAKNGSQKYDEMRFRSVEVISTLFVTPGDIEVFRELDRVEHAEPVWQAGADVFHDDCRASAYFITVGEQVNVPLVLEGRLPENAGECAVEQRLAEELRLKIGDTISDYSMTDDAGQYFLGGEFEITGFVIHPDHVSKTLTETGYVLVLKEAFDLEELDGASMKAEIALKDAGKSRFSGAHKKAVSALTGAIESLAPERTPLTDAAVNKAAHERINEMERQYREDLDRVKRESPDDVDTIKYIEGCIAGLDDYRRDIDEMEPCRWLILDESANAGFLQVGTCSETMRSLQMNFGMMFVLISALTILATVGKMVIEQRTLVGTVKALGFYNREILFKFLLFGVSAVALGAVLGAFTARFFMERIVLSNYQNSFLIDLSAPLFDWTAALIMFFAGIALCAAAVWLACRTLMKESANSLMQPPVPNGWKKAQPNKKSPFGLYSRLILRNIKSDWKRVAITVVCVLGCCAMIGIGFTLKNAVNNCPVKQYSEIVGYDASVVCIPGSMDDMQTVLDEAGAESIRLYTASGVVQTDGCAAVDLLCGDIGEIRTMLHLFDWKTSAPLPPTDEGVYIYRRLAETTGAKVGTELQLTLGLSDTASVKVAGVFENYLGVPIVMSGAYYSERFKTEYEPNTFMVRLNGADEAALSEALKQEWGFSSYSAAENDRRMFEISMGAINSVDALLIAIAAIMAGVVQLNLTTTFIMQKKRELVIMRINGFTVKELIGYLLRESALTAAVGILLGVAAGYGISCYLIRTLELSYTQFDRSFCVSAWLLACAITALFTIVIHAVALQKVKKLKLSDFE